VIENLVEKLNLGEADEAKIHTLVTEYFTKKISNGAPVAVEMIAVQQRSQVAPEPEDKLNALN